MTLRQLQAFVLTCQLGSFTRAAERMLITQSAVTLLIKQLEQALGVTLFDRTTRALRLTSAANEALPIAARMLRNQDLLTDSVRALAEGSRGLVTLGVTVAVAAALMPRVVAAFRTQYPKVTVVMQDLSPEQLVMKMLDEEVEVAIGTLDTDAPDLDLTDLLQAQMSLVCQKGSPIAEAECIPWAAVLEQPVIAIKKGSGIRTLIDETLAAKGKTLVPAYEASLVTTALAMTAEGLGVSILPPYLVPQLPPYSQFAVRPLVDPVVSRGLSIMTKKGRSLSHAAHSFIEVTRRTVGTGVPSPS